MVNTWRNSYFESDGVRALFILPQSWTDHYIPMSVDPQPKELVVLAALGGNLRRALTDVLRVAVNALEQRDQIVVEDFVVVSTPQPPLAAELLERDAAEGARLAVVGCFLSLFGLGFRGLRRHRLGLEFLRRPSDLNGVQILLGTRLAEVQRLRLPFTNLRDVHGGRLGAATALLHKALKQTVSLNSMGTGRSVKSLFSALAGRFAGLQSGKLLAGLIGFALRSLSQAAGGSHCSAYDGRSAMRH